MSFFSEDTQKSQFKQKKPSIAHSFLSVSFPKKKTDPSLADPASLELRLTPLDGGDNDEPSLTTWPRASDGGLFAFHGVPRGRAYSLDVSSPALVFPRVLVEVLESEKEEEEGGGKTATAPFRAWLVAPLADVAAAVGGGGGAAGGGIAGGGGGAVVTAPRDPTATSTAVPLPLESFTRKTTGAGETETVPLLVLRPTARATFFEAPQPFNLVAFLKTPYGMLIGFVAFAVFALPRMKIDPEEYEELLGGGGGGGSAAANNNNNNGAAPSPPRRQLPAGGGGSTPSGLRQRRA